jgi:FKBP-type peptidyl-prolyl cis-trans isomerase FkpA
MRNALLFLAVAGMTTVACSDDITTLGTPITPSTVVTSTAPYSQTDLVVGTGAVAGFGNRVAVGYSGWLDDSSKPDGKGQLFDTQPSFTFQIGLGQVIKGWEQGVVGMRVGGQRRLVVPPELAYGTAGNSSTIPPNATLVFDITLLAVQ